MNRILTRKLSLKNGMVTYTFGGSNEESAIKLILVLVGLAVLTVGWMAVLAPNL